MKRESSTPLELSLEPLEAPAPTASAATLPADTSSGAAMPAIEHAAAPVASPSAESVHARFLAQAAREYEQGQIDNFLWTRALAKADNDQTAARAFYLESRAVALRVLGREKRSKDSARAASFPRADSPPNTAAVATKPPWSSDPPVTALVWVIGAIVVVVVLALGAWIFGAGRSAPDPATSTAKAATAAARPAAAKVASAALSSATIAAQSAAAETDRQLAASVRALHEAGNWNVMVLTATEWTRKAPTNPTAWLRLTEGFVQLRQYNDALDAARRALQLAPDDAILWRLMGQIQQNRNDLPAALHAYEEATRRNGRDGDSFAQIGIIHAQFDRLPEARLAFEQALAIDPASTGALCGAASVAQRQGRRAEAETLARHVATLGVQCPTETRHPGASVGTAPAATPAATAPPPPTAATGARPARR